MKLMGSDRGDSSLTSYGTASWASQAATDFPLNRKTQASARRLMDALTAQQASLMRSVALRDADYLNHSYYKDSATGKRVAHEVTDAEFAQVTAAWETLPVDSIRVMNLAIQRIGDASRTRRYLEAAVELEVMLDGEAWAPGDGTVCRGIPRYLMNGYTDMGLLASTTERNGREKIKVDKPGMRERLVATRQQRIDLWGQDEPLLARYYDDVRRDVEFDERGVEKLSRDFGNESVVLSEYLDKGLGVCRHLSIIYQVYLQEAGIPSRVVKGNLRFFVFNGRHAWNLVWLRDRVALVDVTHPNVNRPFILVGGSEEEVYRRAEEFSRFYHATPDEQNHYKIGT